MADLILVSCSGCGKTFEFSTTQVGATGRCDRCGESFRISTPIDDPTAQTRPAPRPVLPVNQTPEAMPLKPASRTSGKTTPPPLPAWATAPRAVLPANAPPPSYGPPKPPPAPASRSMWATPWPYVIGGFAMLAILLVAIGLVMVWSTSAKTPNRTIATMPPARLPPPVVVNPAPPSAPAVLRPPPMLSFRSGPTYTEGTATVVGRHSRQTVVRLLVPKNAAQPMPCVFVAPAGSNLLVGVPFSDDEYQDYLPLLQTGIAVCLYTLDGTVADLQKVSESELEVAMTAYRESDGGLKNLADAIDTVVTAPGTMIDADRLGAAGHSSSGTIALMAAGREPRIKTAAAFAPAVDLPKRLADVMGAFDTATQQFIIGNSPNKLVELRRRVFVYHTLDDTNVPAVDVQQFANKYASRVTLQLAPSGGHGGALRDGSGPGFAFLARELRVPPVIARNPGSVPPPGTPRPPTTSPMARNILPFEIPTPEPLPDGKLQGPLPVQVTSDSALPDDRPYLGLNILSSGYSIRTATKEYPGYVLRSTVVREIVKPVKEGIAPRIRCYITSMNRAKVVVDRAGDAKRPGGLIGVEKLPDLSSIIYIAPDATEVPFLGTTKGKALRSQVRDRDGGRETDEVLLVAKYGTRHMAFHLICAAGDAAAMAELEQIVAKMKAQDPDK